jgi:hypothetical protein
MDGTPAMRMETAAIAVLFMFSLRDEGFALKRGPRE